MAVTTFFQNAADEFFALRFLFSFVTVAGFQFTCVFFMLDIAKPWRMYVDITNLSQSLCPRDTFII